jgi:hypothetical protein
MHRLLDWIGLRWAGEKLFLLGVALEMCVLAVLLIGPQGIIPLGPDRHLVLLLGTTILFVLASSYLLRARRRQETGVNRNLAEKLFLLSVMLEIGVLGVLLIGPRGIFPRSPIQLLVILLSTTVLFVFSFIYLYWEKQYLRNRFERLPSDHPAVAAARAQFYQADLAGRRALLRRLTDQVRPDQSGASAVIRSTEG